MHTQHCGVGNRYKARAFSAFALSAQTQKFLSLYNPKQQDAFSSKVIIKFYAS